MPGAGRPRNDAVHAIVSRALSSWLRMSLVLSSSELSAWLRSRPDQLGGMLPRDADRFLSGDSIPSAEKLAGLEESAPGLVEIATWPWRALDHDRSGDKALTGWEAAVADFAVRGPPRLPPNASTSHATDAEAIAHTWKMARRFFSTTVRLRRAIHDHALADTCSFAHRLIKDFGNALTHPAISSQGNEVFLLMKQLILERFECAPYTSLLLAECARRHDLDRR